MRTFKPQLVQLTGPLQAFLVFLLFNMWPLACAQLCHWSQVVKEKGGPYRYTYDLAKPMGRFAHGALSEDGFYKVVQEVADGPPTIFWFQLCEAMRFNSAPPDCDQCSESCGGLEHCGATCGALQRVNVGGYAVCTAMASSNNATYGFIDPAHPEKGLAVTMLMGDANGCPDGVQRSLLVNVICPPDRKLGAFEPPTKVSEDPASSCNFMTTITHLAGCPTRTYAGGYFWWQPLVYFLAAVALVFSLYLAVGVVYRTTVHGARGIDAIPHLDFWRSVHEEASVHVRRTADTAATRIQPVLDNHLSPVLQRLGSMGAQAAMVKRRSANLTQAANVIANEATPLINAATIAPAAASTSGSSPKGAQAHSPISRTSDIMALN